MINNVTTESFHQSFHELFYPHCFPLFIICRYYLRRAHGSKRWIVYLEGKYNSVGIFLVLTKPYSLTRVLNRLDKINKEHICVLKCLHQHFTKITYQHVFLSSRKNTFKSNFQSMEESQSRERFTILVIFA